MNRQTAGDNPERPSRVVLPVFVLTMAGTLAWISVIFLAPYLRSTGSGRAAALLYAAFSPLCHQIPSRCFYFHGFPLAVCGRCLGIYVGFLAGLVAYPLIRGFTRVALPPAWVFLCFTLPMGLEALGGILRIWEIPIVLRFATGVIWGGILPFYFITGVAEVVIWRRSRKRRRRTGPGGGSIGT